MHDNQTLFIGNRFKNVYLVDLKNLHCASDLCLASVDEDIWLWYKRLGHASMNLISKLSKNELVKGLLKLKFEKDTICDACQLGKQTKSSFRSKGMISTSKPFDLLHLDLFGLVMPSSLGGKSYAFVIVDDYTRYTWTLFLAKKEEAFNKFATLYRKLQNQKGYNITSLQSDYGREFENKQFEEIYDEFGINHNFSAPRTPQQNGVVERKNRTL